MMDSSEGGGALARVDRALAPLGTLPGVKTLAPAQTDNA
jgi:hypothetical protein